MNSSRMGSVSKICALLSLAAAAACSSSGGGGDAGASSGTSSGSNGTTDGSSSTGSASGSMSAGDGSMCPFTTTANIAFKADVKVKWPGTTGVASATGQDYDFWFLASLTIDSTNKFTGTLKTCNATAPVIPLSMTGAMSVGATGGMAQVQILSPVSLWDKVSRTAKISGSLGGTKGGSSINFDQVVQLGGLSDASTYSMASTAWPGTMSSGYDFTDIMTQTAVAPPGDAMHYTDDDGDMEPGFTVTPNTMNGFYAPHTSLASSSPAVDALYLAQRNIFTLSGTLDSMCATAMGDANFTQIDNHVIGCHVPAGSGGAARECMSSEWQFIDAVQTVYTPMSGTFTAKVMSQSMPTCDDVASALP